jgi:probable rRNA maturation factor
VNAVLRRPRERTRTLEVAVQYGTSRAGVPASRSLSAWAQAAFIAAAGDGLQAARYDLSIRIVGSAESRRLNRTYRGKDKPTNVLSFPGSEPSAFSLQSSAGATAPLGDLAICAPVVVREAREQGKSAPAHWAHMVVHGVLHLLGFDHENDRDANVMEAREVTILESLGYAKPYV